MGESRGREERQDFVLNRNPGIDSMRNFSRKIGL